LARSDVIPADRLEVAIFAACVRRIKHIGNPNILFVIVNER
jgi:hypothetical protein